MRNKFVLMSGFKKYFAGKKNWWFVIIVSSLILVRFLWLNRLPVGINHDELDVILSAKSYWEFGSDLSGVPFPKSLFFTNTRAALSGLPSFILSPFIGMLPTSLMNARIPYVFINLLTIIVLARLVYKLTANKVLSQIIVIISLMNPWLFAYSRATTEAPFALLFLLLGIYYFYAYSKPKAMLSGLFFILSFFSYFGAKPVIPIVVASLIIYSLRRGFVERKTALKLSLFFGLFVVIYFTIFFTDPASTLSQRSGELVFQNTERFTKVVDEQRRASIDSPLTILFFNKGAALFQEIAGKYIGWTTPDYLFFSGDPRATYRFGYHGVFYILDIVFLVLGIYSLSKLRHKSKLLSFIIILVLIAPLSSMLSNIEDSYFFRSFGLIPALVVILALGIQFFITAFKKIPESDSGDELNADMSFSFRGNLVFQGEEDVRGVFDFRIRKYMIAAISIFYIILFVNFFNFFFFRYSVRQQENQFLSERVLANYLIRLSEDENAYVASNSHLEIYHQYIFFANKIGEMQNKDYISTSYSVNKIVITNDCPPLDKQGIYIVSERLLCPELGNKVSLVIQNQKDSGAIFRIYNDTLCKSAVLTPYRRTHNISDYAIEDMDNATFCNRWINKYE